MAVLNWYIVLLIFIADLKNRKFLPSINKFYWMLVMVVVPGSWLLYWFWGRKAHSLTADLFDYSTGLPLSER